MTSAHKQPVVDNVIMPSWVDHLFFGFPAMRFSREDISALTVQETLQLIKNLEREHSAVMKECEALRSGGSSAGGTSTVVAPSPPGGGVVLGKRDLVELAVQTWRLARRIDGLDAEKFPRERKQLADSLRRFQSLLEALKVEIMDPVGQPYVEGWVELEVVSWEPAEPGGDGLVSRVKQTIAPVVRRSGEIIARGQVVVTEIDS